MKKQLIDFLKKLGFSASQIAVLTAEIEKDAPDETALESLNVEVKQTLTSLVLSDPKSGDALQKAGYGKAKNEDETTLKKIFGLTSDDMRDKKFEEVAELAHKKITEAVTKDKQTLVQENVKLTNELKEYKEVILPKEQARIDTEIKAIAQKNHLIKDLSNTEKRKILGKPDAILPSVLAQFNALGIIMKDNDAGGVDYIHKDTNLGIRSKDGTKILGNDEIIDMVLDSIGLKENSTPIPPTPPVPIDKTKQTDNPQTVNHNLGLSEAEAKEAELKAQLEGK